MPSSGFALGQPYGFGRSFQRPVRGTSPAAGASFAYGLDSSYVWRLVSACFTLVTSATVADRFVTLEYQDSDGVTWEATVLGAAVQASTTQIVRASTAYHVSDFGGGSPAGMPVPRAFMQGGGKVAIAVAAIDATDQLSAIRFLFDCFPSEESELVAVREG